MKIIIEKTLHPSWDDDTDGLSDQEVIELVQEDIIDFMDDAAWTVVRERKEDAEQPDLLDLADAVLEIGNVLRHPRPQEDAE